MRLPVSTPAGILIGILLRDRTLPSPAHSPQGSEIIEPNPWQLAHGLLVITCPKIDLATCCVSPLPLQISQVLGRELLAQPLPPHLLHATAVSTFNSRSHPKVASLKLTSTFINAS
ncbi:unannotated protein [freshwater metagenome]|uniref:Unannotated protein n=1 Tax=freshwater metagenome TaxID=449393 RepID=A0A6J7UBH1_9ZZZZ